MTYTVKEAFEILKRYAIAENIEVVRHWLRQGTLKGTPPVTRREGWRIDPEDLNAFMLARVPGLAPLIDPDLSQTVDVVAIKQAAREEMWWELVGKFVFENQIDVRRSLVKDLLATRPFVEADKPNVLADLFQEVPKGKKLRVYLLHGAFPFRGKRVSFDDHTPDLEEEIAGRLIDTVWAIRRFQRE